MQTRYTVKYRHHESKLVLKVTDDVVVRTPDLMSIKMEWLHATDRICPPH